MNASRFHDLATRWLAARMAFMRWRGLQPGGEPQSARLERLRADRARRARQRARGAS